MLELNVNILPQFLWTLKQNHFPVTRYRVTIDFTVNNRGNAPSN